jgi:hypothetical protein
MCFPLGAPASERAEWKTEKDAAVDPRKPRGAALFPAATRGATLGSSLRDFDLRWRVRKYAPGFRTRFVENETPHQPTPSDSVYAAYAALDLNVNRARSLRRESAGWLALFGRVAQPGSVSRHQ